MGRVSGTGRGGGTATAELLLERGVPSEAPAAAELRRDRRVAGRRAGLPEDVAAVRAVLRRVTSRPSWWPTATAASWPRRQPRAARAPSAAGVQLPAGGRAEPLVVRRRGARPVPRHRSRRRARSPSARTPWPRRSCRTAIRRSSARRRTSRRGRAWRCCRRRSGQRPGSTCPPPTWSAPRTAAPRPSASASSPEGRHGRRARRRPPPVPVAAGRGPRPGAQLVSPRPMVAIGGAPCPGSTRACGVNPNRSYSATGPPSQTSR